MYRPAPTSCLANKRQARAQVTSVYGQCVAYVKCSASFSGHAPASLDDVPVACFGANSRGHLDARLADDRRHLSQLDQSGAWASLVAQNKQIGPLARLIFNEAVASEFLFPTKATQSGTVRCLECSAKLSICTSQMGRRPAEKSKEEAE